MRFDDLEPKTLTIEYGKPPTKELNTQVGATQNWVGIENETYPDQYSPGEQIKEPSVYATFSPAWLGQTLLRTRTNPVNTNDQYGWWDEACVAFGSTAVNEVDDRVTEPNRISYETAFAAWLFDRAMTLFNIYVRTGDVKWLRHAHRAAQFYANHISATGFFDLKSRDDEKYSYGEAMWLDVSARGLQNEPNVETFGQ